MNMKNFTTCKLIFDYGTTREDVVKLLATYTDEGSIANWVDDITVGCNRNAFAVVDIPQLVIHKLVNDRVVKDLDQLTTYSLPLKNSCDGGGGCGSCGCSS